MSEARKCSIAFLAYSTALVTIVAASGLGLALVIGAGASLPHTSEIERTLLDHRVESAREIRQALSKPVSRPEPLAPVTAKLARNMEAAKLDTKLASKPKLSKQARDAFASADPSLSSRTDVVPDRHTSNF